MTSKKKHLLVLPGMNQSQEVFSSILDHSVFFNYYLGHSLKPLGGIFSELEKLLSDNDELKYIVAHSFGALVFSEYFKTKGQISVGFQKIIFIGPAFYPRFTSSFIRFLPARLRVPSFNRRRFRVKSFCEVHEYQVVFELQNNFNADILKNLNTDYEIIYDPRDELINTSKLELMKYSREVLSKNFPRHLYFDYIEKLKSDL